jgi:hypothetical protein
MRRKILSWFSVITIVAFVNLCFASSILAQNAPDSDEYSVYTSLLQQEFIGKGTKEIVVRKQTAIDNFSNDESLTYLTESLPSLAKETYEDFDSCNKKSTALTDKFNLKVKVNLVGEEIDRIFYESRQSNSKEDGWEVFHKKYPTAGAIITLSRVGFNKDKSQALVFVAHSCGWLCGEGNYILLEKKDGVWKVEKKSMTWIS